MDDGKYRTEKSAWRVEIQPLGTLSMPGGRGEGEPEIIYERKTQQIRHYAWENLLKQKKNIYIYKRNSYTIGRPLESDYYWARGHARRRWKIAAEESRALTLPCGAHGYGVGGGDCGGGGGLGERGFCEIDFDI